MGKRLITFDLDDTIYKERDFVLSGYRHIARTLAKKYGFDYAEMMHVLTNAPFNAFDSLYEYLTNRAVQQNIPEHEDIAWMVGEYRAHHPEIDPLPDVVSTLGELCRRGNRLAMITDGRVLTQTNKIARLGLMKFIDPSDISISEAIGAEKYHPEPFRRMMSLHPEIEEFVYVGDNPMKDFVWANRLGWVTVQLRDDGRNVHSQNIAIPAPDYAPRHIIDRFADLLPLFP